MAQDIYLYSKPQKGEVKKETKKPHQSRDRARAREQQQLKKLEERDPRRENIGRA